MRFEDKIKKIKLSPKKWKETKNLDSLYDSDFFGKAENIEQYLEKTRKGKECYPHTDFKTVREIFLYATEKYKDNVLFLEKYNKKAPFTEISYGQFAEDVLSFGEGLSRSLKLKGEKVLIIGETTYQWYVSYMALLCGAGIAVPVDKELPDNELEMLINRSDVRGVIFTPKKKKSVHHVAKNCPNVKYFIEMYSSDHDEDGFVGFDFVKNDGSFLRDISEPILLSEEIDPDAFALLIFTSGTTSNSKGVMISNSNLAYNVNAITAFVDLHPDDRLLSVLPLHHTYESTVGFIYPMAMGASVTICQGLRYIVSDMEETSPTSIIAVPVLIEALYKKINKAIEKSGKAGTIKSAISFTNGLKAMGINVKRKVFQDIYDNFGGRLRIFVSAAAPIDPTVGKWLEDIGMTFLQGYGLTETAPIAALTPDFDRRVGSAGMPVWCDEIKINDANDKGEGEIWIKGKTVMLGYFEDEEATAEVLNDGWFNSGDLGYIDKDGFLYITGRSKNVIVTQNGKNIYPEELEALLNQKDEILECMVYGKEVPKEKELVVTVRLIPDYKAIEEKYQVSEEELNEEELEKILWKAIKEVNSNLTNYKTVKRMEIKHGPFEKTTTMKIKRFAELQKEEY
ncbi:MAG: AMP-binding protein [Clostridia bacterium]|nr:AMP-binding protein [Clostridia bacterium]